MGLAALGALFVWKCKEKRTPLSNDLTSDSLNECIVLFSFLQPIVVVRKIGCGMLSSRVVVFPLLYLMRPLQSTYITAFLWKIATDRFYIRGSY